MRLQAAVVSMHVFVGQQLAKQMLEVLNIMKMMHHDTMVVKVQPKTQSFLLIVMSEDLMRALRLIDGTIIIPNFYIST